MSCQLVIERVDKYFLDASQHFKIFWTRSIMTECFFRNPLNTFLGIHILNLLLVLLKNSLLSSRPLSTSLPFSVAGPSVSFDHDRRKARRLVDESPSSPCTPAPATSAPPVDEAPSNAAAPPLQRVLGAVVQHPSSAAAAAATASVHASSCPCVYCPSTHRPRTGIQTLAPPVSQTILGQQPLPAMSVS